MPGEVERPEWLDRFHGETTEWLMLEPGGSIKYTRAKDQEEALIDALIQGIEPSDTHDIRPRVNRREAKLMPNPEFFQKLEQLLE